MLGLDRFAHTDPTFRDLQLLKLHDIISYQTVTFVYKCMYVYENNYGFELATHTNVQTRSTTNHLKIPLCKTSHAQSSVIFRGSKLWNETPLDVRNKPLDSFKLQTKLQLKSKYCAM